MATPSSRSRSHSGTTKKQSNSTSMPQRSKGVRQKSAATAQAATQESISKKVKFSEQPTTNGVENEEEEEEEVEEEYEVECISAHQWSNKHQEYEYFLKWKGYGEEDNSWVPASLMNCWDLLQRYLSANIFNSPSTAASLSTPVPINRTVTPKGKGHSRSKEPRRNRGLKSGRADRTVHSTKANGHPVAHANDPVTSNERSPVSKSEASKGKTGELFSTPKPPLAAKLGQRRQKVVERPSHVKHKRQQPRKLEKIDECDSRPLPCHSTALPSPSASPLMSSCEELSSSQSDCSVSVDDTFRLYLDSDEDSNTSGSQNLLRESPFREEENSEQSSYVQSRSPKLHHISISKAQHRQVNGFKNSESRHAKVTLKCLPNGHSGKPKEKFLMRKNGVSQNLPTSTTSSAADNTDSDTSESWSKRRLRKRGRSSSPTPSLDSTNLETTVDQEEVSSTISPPVVSPQVLQRRLSPSPEYQQELLEWQFLLNKQCRPSEAFILVENRIDEAPIPWNVKYITTNMYGEGVPNPQKPDMAARICGCTCYIMGKRCLPKNEHCCPKMAGADFPYSLAGKVRLPPGNPIYECNSRCSCPPDCTNRIVQHGRKINMCIFRTANGRGWGVKTMEPIKPNTFVTEYVGEVVTTDEAERRGQLYDQEGRTYLFDLDFNCDDNAFTIDAAHYGNISHFFNHSCNPNLRVYSVWIDTLDERLPRIAFFSTQSISAGQELTFDYQMNQEEDGQVSCLCGEPNCCGYLY